MWDSDSKNPQQEKKKNKNKSFSNKNLVRISFSFKALPNICDIIIIMKNSTSESHKKYYGLVMEATILSIYYMLYN